MTVYADVLVALNVLLTYILLVAVRIMCKCPTNKWAVMIASLLGGFSSLIIFWDDLGNVFSFVYKLISGAVIVGVAFLPKKPKPFLKTYLSFFLVSFLFGGAMYAVQLTLTPDKIIYFNGTVYFDMSLSYLVGCVLSVYGVFLVANYLLEKRTLKCSKCVLEICFNNISVTIPAIVDTGNSLVDGMSARPVVVAELSAIAPLFEREELSFFKNQSFDNVPKSLMKIFRLVPCSAVTGESLLPSFIPSYVKITTEKGVYKTDFCTIGVVNKELSQGEYKALLNNNIFENVKEESANEKNYL